MVKLTLSSADKEKFKEIYKTRNPYIQSFPGCNSVSMYSDKNSESTFFTISIWDDEASLNQYRDTEYFKETWGMLKPLFKEKAVAWSLVEII